VNERSGLYSDEKSESVTPERQAESNANVDALSEVELHKVAAKLGESLKGFDSDRIKTKIKANHPDDIDNAINAIREFDEKIAESGELESLKKQQREWKNEIAAQGIVLNAKTHLFVKFVKILLFFL
jgi:hypothetical protein